MGWLARIFNGDAVHEKGTHTFQVGCNMLNKSKLQIRYFNTVISGHAIYTYKPSHSLARTISFRATKRKAQLPHAKEIKVTKKKRDTRSD
jgi:hypothetical protein